RPLLRPLARRQSFPPRPHCGIAVRVTLRLKPMVLTQIMIASTFTVPQKEFRKCRVTCSLHYPQEGNDHASNSPPPLSSILHGRACRLRINIYPQSFFRFDGT